MGERDPTMVGALRYQYAGRSLLTGGWLTFDPLGPPEAAANLTLRLLLNPERCARLINQQAMNADLPGMNELIETLINQSFRADRTASAIDRQKYTGQIRQMLMHKTVEGLIGLATNKEADGRVREVAHNGLMKIKKSYLLAGF